MPTPHTIEPGDCLVSLAHAHGLPPQKVWDLPENEPLRQAAPDTCPEILPPGEAVHLPEIQKKSVDGATDQRHRFQTARGAFLRLRFLDHGEPRAQVPYRLEIDGLWREGTTDADGCLEEPIPPTATEARLRLGPANGAEDYVFKLGHLDPLATVSGVQARLNNLGYQPGPIDGVWGPRTAAAWHSFQRDHDLERTDAIDAATKDALRDYHRS